jgi:hypothetical protein
MNLAPYLLGCCWVATLFWPVLVPVCIARERLNQMYPSNWPRCACGDFALDEETCGRAKCSIAYLAAANRFVETNYPLPRCDHGNALRDHSGEVLEPTCGCRA